MDSAGRYIRFLGWAVLVIAVLAGIGFVPTRRVAGDEAPLAMLVGCLISWVSAAAAGWPLVTRTERTPTAQMQTAFLAMTVRLAVVIALGMAAVFTGFDRAPLLFWLAVSYMALLPLEVKLAISA